MENQKESQNAEISAIIQILPRYADTLCREVYGYFNYFLEPTIATDTRKALLLENINLIKDKLISLEEIINSTNRN